MQRGILKRLDQLEAHVEVSRLDLAGVSDTDLERLEAYFLQMMEVGSTPNEFGALSKRLRRIVLNSMGVD